MMQSELVEFHKIKFIKLCSFLYKKLGAVLDNHKWGYHGTYEKESFKQAQTSPSD